MTFRYICTMYIMLNKKKNRRILNFLERIHVYPIWGGPFVSSYQLSNWERNYWRVDESVRVVNTLHLMVVLSSLHVNLSRTLTVTFIEDKILALRLCAELGKILPSSVVLIHVIARIQIQSTKNITPAPTLDSTRSQFSGDILGSFIALNDGEVRNEHASRDWLKNFWSDVEETMNGPDEDNVSPH